MKQFILREIPKNEPFDPSGLCAIVPFTQAEFYGRWQEVLGRTVRRFTISDDEKIVAYFQLIRYPLFLGASYLSVPYGPIITESSEDFFSFLKEKLEQIGKQEKAVFVRLDFTPIIQNALLLKFFVKAHRITYHGASFQPRTEWFLSLEKPEAELLSGMHEKTRYAIRLAERKGITTEIIADGFENYVDIFYTLMAETAARNNFHLHPKKYYQNIFHNPPPHMYLSVARYGQKILAIDLIVIFSTVANYVFGASHNEEKNRMPTYAAQWRAICHAKQLGCMFYNFGGISTERMPRHSWEGLTRFKKSFGGEELVHSDFFDTVINPFLYFLYTMRKRVKTKKLTRAAVHSEQVSFGAVIIHFVRTFFERRMNE